MAVTLTEDLPIYHYNQKTDMRKYFRKNLQKRLFIVVFFTFGALNLKTEAQVTVQIGSGTDIPPNTLYSPIYRFSATSTTTGSRSNILFLQSEMAAAGIPAGATITSVQFNKTNADNFVTPATHSMLMANTTNTTLPLTTTWASILGSHTQVYTNNAFNIPNTAGWVTWSLTPFVYTGGALEIATETAMAGNGGATGPFAWEYTAAIPADLIVGVASATGATLNGNVAAYKHRPNIRITYNGGSACTSPPVPGTAVLSPATPVCSGATVSLNLTGNSSGSGQTYVWQVSNNIGGPFLPESGSLTSPFYNTTAPNGTRYYRAAVTCSGNTQFSTTIAVTGSAPFAAGVYTINSALPTGGTNFQSFGDAIAALNCGINGPVIFNVNPLSGPYIEQAIINPISGASAVNTITFNGNGRVIQFTSTNTDERAVIKLNGADHITFDSLTINAIAAVTGEYAFGIQLLNDADSNVFRKCIINAPDNFVSTNHVGISISASATSATGTGSSLCDDNLFDRNTITGGYYGITNVGSTTEANQRNRFINNTIKDYYIYGIYSNGTFAADITGNDISRPARANIGTAASYGIYFTSLSTRAKVNGNRIHGLLDVNPASTNDVYGIYFTGVDALAGLENVVSNNAIYDIKSNGLVYGIYNASSDNVFYYHNTISLDDAASTTTEVTRGIYQTTAAAGIEIKNNIITLRRGGTGLKHGLFFNTTTSTIVSNYNNVNFTPAANVFYGSWGTAGQATLANWQAASSQDANSHFLDPLYVNMAAGNLQPTAAALNDLGTPVGITTDILGAARSGTNPDIGAWEFTVGGCTAPPVAGTATVSTAVPICPGELVALNLSGNSIGLGQTYQWQSGPSASGPWTNVGLPQNNPALNVNPTTTTFYRTIVTCSGSPVTSTSVGVVVNSSFPGGTYTINSAVATGGANFQTFTDAYFALRCGISGPVVFNVVSGSGPYNEQLIMGQVNGASSVNTVTWNGNGATVTFLSTNTNERAVFKLNGTDHFIFDSLTVVPQGTLTTEYGYGFHLMNNADSNIIRRCTINLNTTSTSTNYAGIVSSIGVTAIATGANESDFNLIDRNTINGGYYGITSVGSSTVAVANNKIINNNVRDFYSYGIYINGNFNTLVEGNNISRPARTDVSTHYGIYHTALSTGLKISKNRIHNPFGGELASTSIFYGIYFTAVDALAGLENVVSNNVIYNVNGNGTQYGLYNTGSDNVLYYHNTINLDGAATTTNNTYGFYQTTTAAGIDLKNNLITISRGGTGNKFCLYFATAASTITSNYNGFYRNATNTFIGFNGTNQVTLANWQSATTQDANSIVGNPYYTNLATGNLEPRSPVLDNKGTPIPGITTDIDNEVRSATTPDIGAWEFAVPPCVAPPTAGTATAIPNSNICLGTSIMLDLTGNSVGATQTFQWQVASAVGGPYTNLGGVLQFPDTTIFAAGTFWYRAVVTCGAQSANSVPVQVVMTPPFPAGTYTINNTQPTNFPGGSNFNSFVEAVAIMECGIAGPVIFNVAPGTYTEQVRMHAITGTSATSRVTFQSANANPASVILTYNSTVATDNYVLLLDSASYITYKAMTITASNTTNGRAVSFLNTASYDSLLNCVINAPASTVTTTTSVGVFGDDLSGTNITIKGNTITGGMAGIHFTGLSTTQTILNNLIDSNTVNGSYFYNIYRSNARFSSITRNTVAVAMPRNTTAYGIYLTNNDSAYQVNANNVTLDGTTVTAYGIYLTGCAAVPYTASVSRNIITGTTGITGSLYGLYQTSSQGNNTFNNVIHVNSSGATVYGLYSTAGNGIRYFNNTAQNASASTAATNAAAYFSHTSSTIDIGDIRNNVFSQTGGGYAVNYVNADNIYSDFNMFYSAGANLIRQNTINYISLQAWRDAESWDYNSIAFQPAFVTGTLQPDAANANSWAMHGRGVQITDNASDINGNPRPTTLLTGVPDLGAYEFLPTVLPPVLPATPAAPAAGITQVFMFGTDTVQKISWAPASTVPTTVQVRRYSGIIPPGLTAGQKSMYFYADVDYTGSAPTNFKMEQFYIDPWMRDIGAEPTVKMGRTNAATAWLASSNSTVHTFYNLITEENLNFLDKFTGMTDGVAPPPPGGGGFVTTDTSNRGRRFWVGYGHHSFFNVNTQSMVLYLSAEQAANVTVKVNGTNWVRNYAIPANSVRVSDLMPKTGLSDARLKNEGLFNTGISIESDVPIVVYAHIYAGLNSGATMLLPVGTYGYEYTSLNSAQFYPSEGDGPHSWFYAMADRDSTLVRITPSQNTKGGRLAGVPFEVYLNKGQAYQVLGTYTNAGGGFLGVDMSGSTIKSIPNASGKCYPIAVFSGSSRTSLCNDFGGDNLIQQVFPNQAWGTKYLTFGTAKSGAFPTTYNSNKWRILVKDPATVVRRNGVVIPQASLVVPGNYYEFGITQGDGPSTSSYIEANQPVMVAQYMISLNGSDCPGLAAPTGLSDPEMIYISPLEQGIKRAVFYNTDVSNIDANFINVIIPTAGLASLTIDGASTFTHVFPHPQLAGYSCVRQNLPATAGQHIIQSDSAFSAITYGLGSEESYGYNAGTLVKNLTAIPSFNNVFNTAATSTYTCKGTPFRLSVQISVKPSQIIWALSQVPNVTPNINVTQTNPVPADSVTVNGKKFYIFTLPQQYTFSQVGNYNVPIQIFHPSIEGCNGSYEILLPVAVIPAPVSNFTIIGSGCVGDAFAFSATTTTSNNVPTNQWTWNFGDATTGAGQNVSHSYATAGTYNVMLRGIANDGCIGDTTKPVVVNPRPVVNIIQDTVYVCSGSSAAFAVQNPVTGTTYNWFNAATGGTLLGTGTNFTLNNVTGFTNIWLEGVQSGCASVVRDRATAGILPSLTLPVVVVDSIGTNILIFRWGAITGATGYQVSVDGGTTWNNPSSGPQGLTHTITGLQLGTTVTLRVRALGGCLAAVSQPVAATTRTDQVYIPNAFTPNGDGRNDILLVYSNSIRSLRFTVFNQWGEKIFETTSQSIGWNGTHNNKPQPSGVYIYVCDIILNTGERIQRKGGINLVR